MVIISYDNGQGKGVFIKLRRNYWRTKRLSAVRWGCHQLAPGRAASIPVSGLLAKLSG